MIKTIVLFIVLTVGIGVAIRVFRSLTGREKLSLVASIAYATLCSTIAVILLSIVVILF